VLFRSRPFVRFLATLFSGKSEDVALAEIGISRRDFLDAQRSLMARLNLGWLWGVMPPISAHFL
jgi:hypothetical protein